MDNESKIALLQRLLDQSSAVTIRDYDDPTFKSWKNTVERTFIRVFGHDSAELKQFQSLRFFYRAVIMSLGSDYSREHRECFDRDFAVLLSTIKSCIEELNDFADHSTSSTDVSESRLLNKVFISHSSKDLAVVESLIELLELMGLSSEQIFCTSLEGYGITLGDNFLDVIKSELSSDTMVLFVLTRNFFASPVCLCEMGATWIQTMEHVPVLVPPFDFKDIQGVIPLIQGMRINDALKMNLLKEKVENLFGIRQSQSQSVWERKRDRVLARIAKELPGD